MKRIERAIAVNGWMEPEELVWLEQHACVRETVIELGSWYGRSSVALAAARKLVCVDTWLGSPGEWKYVSRVGLSEIYDQFCRNLAGELASGVVQVRRGDLADEQFRMGLIAEFGGTADMVFVDASHDEASVESDIGLARSMLRPEGLLCGHDYSQSWPGVMSAVSRLVPNVQNGPVSIWCEA